MTVSYEEKLDLIQGVVESRIKEDLQARFAECKKETDLYQIAEWRFLYYADGNPGKAPEALADAPPPSIGVRKVMSAFMHRLERMNVFLEPEQLERYKLRKEDLLDVAQEGPLEQWVEIEDFELKERSVRLRNYTLTGMKEKKATCFCSFPEMLKNKELKPLYRDSSLPGFVFAEAIEKLRMNPPKKDGKEALTVEQIDAVLALDEKIEYYDVWGRPNAKHDAATVIAREDYSPSAQGRLGEARALARMEGVKKAEKLAGIIRGYKENAAAEEVPSLDSLYAKLGLKQAGTAGRDQLENSFGSSASR